MNRSTLQRNARLRELLAAEYVLGTLKGAARRRFEHWLGLDALVAQSVADWNARLQPLAELARAVPPPQRVWRAIERRIGPRTEASAWDRLAKSLRFWRALGLAASAAALVLAAVMVLRPFAPAPAGGYVATLSGDNAQPALVVTGDAARRTLTLHPVALAAVGADRSLELWAVPSQGAPVALGLLAPGAPVTLTLPAGVTPQSMPMLAVSLEPKGGSPNPHAPTGPILYKGAWVRI